MLVRPIALPIDRAGLLALDTAFVTDRIYQVRAEAVSFALVETAIIPPLHVNYPAIQFYRRMGFLWCGLDQSLSHPTCRSAPPAAW